MYTYNAKVIKIIDGDSVFMDVDLGFGCHLLGDGRGVNIRLHGRGYCVVTQVKPLTLEGPLGSVVFSF